MATTETPQTARTNDQMAELERDNIEGPNGTGFLLGEGSVSVHFAPGKWLEIPRGDMDAFVRWYMTGEAP